VFSEKSINYYKLYFYKIFLLNFVSNIQGVSKIDGQTLKAYSIHSTSMKKVILKSNKTGI